MKRVLGSILAVGSLVGGAAVAFPACVHDDSTMFILDALAQPTGSTSGQCSYTSDPTQPYLPQGIVDFALRQEYVATFLVGNQMVPEVNPTQLMTETSFINIQGAVVRVTKSDGTPVTSFTRLVGATIPPSTGSTPGYGPVSVLILDPTTILSDNDVITNIESAAIPGPSVVRFVTYTKFFGQTLGGKSVESNEFEFPVDVCSGCLIGFSNGPGHPAPNCVPTAGTTTTVTAPCLAGQDSIVPCGGVCGIIPICAANDAFDGGP
jgi:hypothetical protein